MIRSVLLGLALLALPSLALAQSRVTNTTLSNAITATQTVFAVASATDFAAGSYLWVDREVMVVRSVSSTTITVSRGQMGTQAAAHAASETIFVSTSLTTSAWRETDPDYGAACTPGTGQAAVAPWFNVRTGTIWKCLGPTGVAGTWNGTNTAVLTYNSVQTGAQ